MRKRLRDWLTSHALWEAAKWLWGMGGAVMSLAVQYIIGWARGHQDAVGLLITASVVVLFAVVAIIVHRTPSRGTAPSQPPAPVGPTPPMTKDLIAGAPRLLIRYTSQGNGKVTFINDGPGSMVNLKLGPLMWGESRRLRIEGSVGVLLPGTTREKDMSIETRPPGTWGELCDYMRESTPNDAQHKVTVTYQDSNGTIFARDFLLTSQIDGTVEWKPGPVVVL